MHVLVSVASRHGATQEMGEVVANALADAGHEVDVLEPDDVDDVRPYDAVVLGSSVYVGRLAASLRDLVQRQEGQLRERPVWLFWSGPVGDPPMPAGIPDDVQQIASHVAARGVQCFVGRLDHRSLSVSERALVALTGAPDGDFREMDDVAEWGRAVAEMLPRTVATR